MVQVNPSSSVFSVTVNSTNAANQVGVGRSQSYYDALAREWAISPNIVQNEDYSSKYYAGKSQEYADSILQDAGFIAVSQDLTNIDTVANSITNVNAVATDISNVNAVYADLSNIDSVAGDLTNIDSVAGSISNVNSVAGDLTNINSVASDLTNVGTVASNITDINTCSTNIADINTCADNIAVITNKANISLDNLNATGKARIAVKQYLITETFIENDIVIDIDSDNRVSMYRSLIDHNTGNPLSDTNSWEKINLGGGSKDIGDISMAITPKVNACEHLLDGALINGSGIYADFVDYIAGLTTDYPDLFETEANWQTAVSTYGVCAKFVYDSVNGTVRLPKITGIVEGTTDLTALGDLIEAGLPNIEGNVGIVASSNQSGAFATGASSTNRASGTGNTYYNANFNASRISSIYGNSTTVQPQTIKVLFYICIATATKTSIEVDIDEIATDLNGKLDLDTTNATTTTKARITNWSCPSAQLDVITLGASGATYTAPYDGWFQIGFICGDTGDITANNLTTGGSLVVKSVWGGNWVANSLEVNKGDVVQMYYPNNITFSGGSIQWHKKNGAN